MIPSSGQIAALWDACALPEAKRIHCTQVARLAVWFARSCMSRRPELDIDIPLLFAAAMVHDVDKAAQTLPHEHHPDAAVRILREHGMDEVADLVRTHPLHAICDQYIAPRTWEQKLLYLSDKMAKQEIITVDERFALWRAERLPPAAVRQLDAAYPRVKELEASVCSLLNVEPDAVAGLVNAQEMSTMGLSEKGGV